MTSRIGVPQWIVVSVLIFIERLRVIKVGVESGIRCRISYEEIKFGGTAGKFIRTREPSLDWRVVPSQEIIQPRFRVSFLLGELLAILSSVNLKSGIEGNRKPRQARPSGIRA
jgi:hypothetical protein